MPLEYATANLFMGLQYFAGLNAQKLSPDEQRKMGYELSEIMLSCVVDLRNCTENDFEWYYDTLYG